MAKEINTSKPEKAKKEKENIFARAAKRTARWFREMKSELKKVVWPSAKTLRNNVFISIGMMLVSAVAIWVFDGVASMLVKGIFTFLG
jgi:preprotein translocase subunit SecE